MKLRQYKGRFSNRSIFHKIQVISRFTSIFNHFRVVENLFTSILYRKRPIHMTSYEQVYRFKYSIITFKFTPQHIHVLNQNLWMETYKTPPNFMYIINPLQPYIENPLMLYLRQTSPH